jgi:alpha-L-rhamnosidase
MNTLAWYFAITETANMCEILGKKDYLPYLNELKEKVKKAINDNYFNSETLNYADGIQGANILPAINGVADNQTAKKLLDKMIEKYERDPHFDTGIVLTPRLLDALTAGGRSDIALKVLTEKTGPSYYDMLKGETTLPEHWFKHWPGSPDSYVSHSHPMFGSVLGWVYKNVAGLDLTHICDKKIVYAPKVVKEISSASMYKTTIYGKASIEYSTNADFIMKITVPFGIKGEVVLPDYISDVAVDNNPVGIKDKFTLDGGKYVITGKIK